MIEERCSCTGAEEQLEFPDPNCIYCKGTGIKIIREDDKYVNEKDY